MTDEPDLQLLDTLSAGLLLVMLLLLLRLLRQEVLSMALPSLLARSRKDADDRPG